MHYHILNSAIGLNVWSTEWFRDIEPWVYPPNLLKNKQTKWDKIKRTTARKQKEQTNKQTKRNKIIRNTTRKQKEEQASKQTKSRQKPLPLSSDTKNWLSSFSKKMLSQGGESQVLQKFDCCFRFVFFSNQKSCTRVEWRILWSRGCIRVCLNCTDVDSFVYGY